MIGGIVVLLIGDSAGTGTTDSAQEDVHQEVRQGPDLIDHKVYL